MTVPTAISSNDLKDRRKQRHNQRNVKFWLFLWRLFFLSSLTLGVSGIMTLPYWMIQNPSQIEVQGNQRLSSEQIRSWLPIPYPQQIWRLPIATLAKQLEKIPPVAQVSIARQIFPPKLTVEVRERQPVAIANTSKGAGFLDAGGVWINRSFYQKEDANGQKFPLVVLGFDDIYRSDWSNIYRQILTSTVKIEAVDWRNATNLILKTELGPVYFGAYNRQFAEKLAVLEKMKVLPSRIPGNRVVYIDLTNPLSPTVQVVPPPPPVKKENEKSTG